ncbi:lactococcin [Alkaliphilus pronyensis]|uniref:Lactococcin n=1 Tax=Alkaliphilus pronyensis TaxID=1482732 RepID=A0A6I0FE40_9FIRM|nr:bacteriorhodopsin [Alkaliphilus pronyensis]KAB3533457.1 lactococcin [Alkaliphilus pronyensis]
MDEFILQLHWFYAAVMLAGALYFYFQSRNPQGVPQYEYLIAIFIPVWSAIAYFSIAIGQGFLKTSEQTVFFARYLDWIVTTPLLLLSLALTAMFYTSKNISIILSLVFADIIMILSGLIADLSEHSLKYIWYSIGMVALFIILFIIWVPLYKIAKASDTKLSNHYKTTALYLTVLWISYPTVWLIGPSGLGLITESSDVLAFIFLPIFSKVGFSMLDLYGLRRLKPYSAIRQ